MDAMDLLERVKMKIAEVKTPRPRPVLDKFRATTPPPAQGNTFVPFSQAAVRGRFYVEMAARLEAVEGEAPGEGFVFEGEEYTWSRAINTLVRLDRQFGDDLRSQYLAGRRAFDRGVPEKDNPWNATKDYWQNLRWYGGWHWGRRDKYRLDD